MIKSFLRERASWILFFLFIQLLALFIAWLDPEIPLSSLLYYTFLSITGFILFLALRFSRETDYYKKLEARAYDHDLTTLPEAVRPFEKIVEVNLTEEIERLNREAARIKSQSEKEQDDLLSWIHEVKTPMTALNLIIQRGEDAKLKRQMTYEWLRIHLLLDQQLHQKRIPSIENDLYIEKVELEPLIHQELRTLQSWCMQKGIGFHVELQVKDVLTDAKWLSFILRQLLSNAVKYSEDSEIMILTERKNGRVTLSVKDEGRGMDTKDLPRIFEKGFTSTTSHHDGKATGMGLYLAKRAADSLHVDIHVSSKMNKGTLVTLTFPLSNSFTTIPTM